MTVMNIISDPPTAEVRIGGALIGVTPTTCEITGTDLVGFRKECLTGETVSCTWDILKTRLEDHTVSRLWWQLTREERYSITRMAAARTIPKDARYNASGLSNCEGEDEASVWINAVCHHDALIKYMKFVGGNVPGADKCYYKLKYLTAEPQCYVPDHSYNLPGAIASYSAPMGDQPTGYGHGMFAILIDEDMTKVDNWVIFQYSDFDIKIGNWQMPAGPWKEMKLKMYKLGRILPGCNGSDDVIVLAEWYYNY